MILGQILLCNHCSVPFQWIIGNVPGFQQKLKEWWQNQPCQIAKEKENLQLLPAMREPSIHWLFLSWFCDTNAAVPTDCRARDHLGVLCSCFSLPTSAPHLCAQYLISHVCRCRILGFCYSENKSPQGGEEWAHPALRKASWSKVLWNYIHKEVSSSSNSILGHKLKI